MKQADIDTAPVIAQDGYNFPPSHWICWECGVGLFSAIGATKATVCPKCGEPAEYFDGILVDRTAEEVRADPEWVDELANRL